MTSPAHRPGERVQTVREHRYGTVLKVMAGGHSYVVHFDDGEECQMGWLSLQAAVSPLRCNGNVVRFQKRFMCASRSSFEGPRTA